MEGPALTDPLPDAIGVAEDVRRGRVSAEEVVSRSLERIRETNPVLGAFVHVDKEGALARAREVDASVREGRDPGPLAGVPVGVKDLENAAGMPTRRGSLLFSSEPAPADSTQVARLRRAGAVVVGKTATPEVGSLAYTWSKAHGAARNPWDPALTPGGSSGGSAAAVAAGMVPLATGSDGGGSLRIPASFCGIPTIKATLGRIPRGPGRMGRAAVSVPGTLARSIRDLALFLDVAAGPDPHDPLSLPDPPGSYRSALGGGGAAGRGLRAAFSATLGFGACDPDIAAAAREAAAAAAEAAGIDLVDYEPKLPDAAASWLGEAALDTFAEMEEHWPARREEMTPMVSGAMLLAGYLDGPQFAEIIRLRHSLVTEVARVFENVDVVMTPTMPVPPFPAEGPMPDTVNGSPFPTAMGPACFVFPFNLSGSPAVSLPAGPDPSGLPTGLQIAGPRFSEALLLSIAAAYEKARPWTLPPPPGERGP